MQIKRYEASNTSKAMEKIKADLGPDAIVLSTRKLRGGIEVVAGVDHPEPKVSSNEETVTDVIDLFKGELSQMKALINDGRDRGDIYDELAKLRESIGILFDSLGVPKYQDPSSPLSKVYYHLLSVGISKQKASSLINDLNKKSSDGNLGDYALTLKAVEDRIRRAITPSYKKSQGKKRISAFLGPSGEGKTTTLAKLAARSMFGEKRTVGVITLDTQRIGGVEQLRRYTDIMDVPMEVVSERNDFNRVLSRFSDRDVILIDTPGNARGHEGLRGLKESCSSVSSVEMNLVLSVTSSQESMMDVVTGFEGFGFDNIILTKLDNSKKIGSIYNVIEDAGKPVSFIANGQNVPRDLREMNPERLARLIVENSVH